MNNSKRITDYKLLTKNDVFEILKKYDLNSKKPIPEYAKEIKEQIILKNYQNLIIDCFCGVGESTYKLAQKYPEYLVIGFDKSFNRLKRKNSFKEKSFNNLLLFQSDIFDFYQILKELTEKVGLKVIKQYVLYPNPWPKKKNAKKRIYLNNVIPYLFYQACEIEIRSNWGRLLVEFSFSAEYYNFDYVFEKIVAKNPLTPFEKKYYLSGQNLNRLLLKPR